MYKAQIKFSENPVPEVRTIEAHVRVEKVQT
jgi:hypothetical protein